MKRDMDLIRKILLEIEESPSLEGCHVEIPGYSAEELYYNAKQAQGAGLIEAKFLPGATAFLFSGWHMKETNFSMPRATTRYGQEQKTP